MSWKKGNKIGGIYEFRNEDLGRIGSCDFVPEEGDLCLCTEHSGDCFNNYIAYRFIAKEDACCWPEWGYEEVGRFGAFKFGNKREGYEQKTFLVEKE